MAGNNELAQRLAAARAGSPAALGQLLEGYRTCLLLRPRQTLGVDPQAKCSARGLVQEACLEAQRDLGQFRGQTEPELQRRLRRLLLHNLRDVIKRFRDTDKRELV